MNIKELLKDREWLENKIINEGYSCSRLAREYNSNRFTVDSYVKKHGIVQPLSQKELEEFGFNKEEISSPDYRYVIGDVTESRFTKDILVDEPEVYKIYNCGGKKYIKGK